MFHRNEQGASALEFALVLPILVVLIFGAFTVGIGYDRKLSLAHASRDSARFGATLPFEADGNGAPTDVWFAEIRDRAVAASTGHLLRDGVDGTQICIAYVEGYAGNPASLSTASKAIRYSEGPSGWTATAAGNRCFDDELGDVWCAEGDTDPPCDVVSPDPPNHQPRVQVASQREFDFNLILLPVRTFDIMSSSVARFEEIESSDDPSASESPSE